MSQRTRRWQGYVILAAGRSVTIPALAYSADLSSVALT